MDREDNILSDAAHLYAEDLGGRDVTLTVRSITKEEVRGGASGKATEKRYTFRFAETPKAYIPGVGVRRAIVAAVGSTDRAKIVGKRLVFYPTTCSAFGEPRCPCIRFRGLAPATPAGNRNQPPAAQATPAAEQEGTADAR
jgi:hypothetical protein